LVTGCEIRPVLTLDEHLKTALDKGYKAGQQAVEQILGSMDETDANIQLTEADGEDAELGTYDLEKLANDEDSPAVKFLNMIVFQAAKEKASDIHIEPYERKLLIRFRKDGALREAFTPPRKMLNAIVSRVKIMASLDIAE